LHKREKGDDVSLSWKEKGSTIDREGREWTYETYVKAVAPKLLPTLNSHMPARIWARPP
jgi:hypothetical protein